MPGGDGEHQKARAPTRIPAVTALLSAAFTYFAFTMISTTLLDTVFGMEIFHTSNFPLMTGIVVLTGALLWGIAGRYHTARVQAGAIIGAGIMTVVGFAQTWGFWREGIFVPFVVTLPTGVGIIAVVSRLSANPDPAAGERSGFAILRRLLPGVNPERGEEDSAPADATESARADSRPTTEPATPSGGDEAGSDWGSRLPGGSVSRYWLVVGGAFAVTIPIALYQTDLGIGLLSAFLTAYALSHQIEQESGESKSEGET